MFTGLHYLVTRKILGEFDAYISFLVDLSPAKEVIHRKMWITGGLYDYLERIPQRFRRGVFIHVLQDIWWYFNVRKNYMSDNIWSHRYLEIAHARKYYPFLPELDVDLALEFLGLFGDVDERFVRRQYDVLYEVLFNPSFCDEFFKDKLTSKNVNVDLIEKYYEEDKLIFFLKRFF